MGNFANTLFSALLGWVQSAASWLWQIIGADGADGLMGWVLDNWLPLALLLCGIGLAVDLVVYLIRWQPYRVWRIFRKKEEPEPEEELPAPEAAPMQWVYANGETAPEPVPPPAAPVVPMQLPEIPATPVRQETPARGVQRVIPARRRRTADGSVEYILPPTADAQQGYHSPYYPPQWQHSEHQSTDGGMQQ